MRRKLCAQNTSKGGIGYGSDGDSDRVSKKEKQKKESLTQIFLDCP
jgi:hypothetical protein